jgi:hypothetical protein
LLFLNGYCNLTLIDIEDESIAHQNCLFAETVAKKPDLNLSQVKIVKLDLTRDVPQEKYEVFIDKGFMDVFLR